MGKREAGFVGSGFALVATCYGLARFAYGLFPPAIGAELGLGQTQAGLIGAGAFRLLRCGLRGLHSLRHAL